MKWMKDFYVGDRALKLKKKIVRGIRWRRPLPDAYILTIASNPRNQIDILRAYILRQPYFRKNDDIVIIGIAKGHQDALDLMLRITDECVRRTGTADVRSYLEEKIREGGTI